MQLGDWAALCVGGEGGVARWRPGPGEVKLREFRREACADGPHLHHGLGRAGLQHRDPGSALLEPEYGGVLGSWLNSDAPPALRSRPPSARPLRGSHRAGQDLRGAQSPAPRAPPLSPLRVLLFHARFSRPVFCFPL